MNETRVSAFADPELSKLFEEEPELLAIADAITSTAPQRTARYVARESRRRGLLKGRRLLIAAALVAAAVVAAPALALSPSLRAVVGLRTTASQPQFVARVTDVFVHGSRPLPGTLVTVTFTVGERGKPPGTGIPQGSTFFVLASGSPGHLATAHGKNGLYRATIRLAQPRIGMIQVGGFMPQKGPQVLNGGIWIPTTIDIPR
jgi:hypothetical protein